MQRLGCIAKEFREAQQETIKAIEKAQPCRWNAGKVLIVGRKKPTSLSLGFRFMKPPLENNFQERLTTFWT